MTDEHAVQPGRVTVHSHPERARYDLDTAMAVLDDGLIGHLATVFENGVPHLVPMMYVRQGEYVHLHGRKGTRLMNHLAGGAPLVFSVTLVDGLVLARSVRYNSVNYRSVVIHGAASEVDDMDIKRASFAALAEQHWPGRVGVAPPTLQQLKTVTLLALPLKEFSAKVRTGPPAAVLPEDGQQVWAGHVDLRTVPHAFHPDALTPDDLGPPSWPIGRSVHASNGKSP